MKLKLKSILVFVFMAALIFPASMIGIFAAEPEEELFAVSIADVFNAADDSGGTSIANSSIIESYNVCQGRSASQGILPAPTFGGSIKPSTGYVVYRIGEPGGLLEEGVLKFGATIKNQFKAAYNGTNFKVYLSTDNTVYGDAAATYNATNKGSNTAVEYELDLADYLGGLENKPSAVYIKIEMNHAVVPYVEGGTDSLENASGLITLSNTCTKLYTVNIDYKYSVAPIELTYGQIKEQFNLVAADGVTELASSQIFEYDNICHGKSANQGLMPAPNYAGSIKPSTGYVVYRVQVPAGNILASLKLDFSAVIKNHNSAAYNSTNFKVYATHDKSDYGEPLKTFMAIAQASQAFSDYVVDFESILYPDAADLDSGYRTIYIKIEMNHAVVPYGETGSIENESGAIPLSSVCTKLGKVEINYGYKAGDAAAEFSDYLFEDDYKVMKAEESQFALSYEGIVGGKQPAHGYMPGDEWADPFNAGAGYIIYRVKMPDGGTINSLSIKFNARVSYTDNQALYTEKNRIKLYMSTDAITWGDPVYEVAPEGAYTTKDYTADVSEFANGKTRVYFKLELVHAEARVAMSVCGIKLFSVTASGDCIVGDAADSEEFVQDVAFDAQGMAQLHEVSNMVSASLESAPYAILPDEQYGYLVMKIDAPEYKMFQDLDMMMKLRCTSYDEIVPAENVFLISLSSDGVNYTLAQSLNMDRNWSRRSAIIELTDIVKGNTSAYIKIEFRFPESWTEALDWVGIGATTFTGTTVYRSTFDIEYRNMEGATPHATTNPATYNYGTATEIGNASKDNYVFAGWYSDAEFETEFEGVTATTRGDLVLYAKWIPEDYTIILDANGGAFAGGAASLNITGYYDNTLSGALILQTPVKEDVSFIRWTLDAAGTIPWIFAEEPFTATVINAATLAQADVTPDAREFKLYAQYGAKVEVILEYDAETTQTLAVANGEKINRPIDPSKEGYKFGGWYLDGNEYDFETAVTAPITLTAKWYEIFTISYTNVAGAAFENPTTFTADLANITLAPATKTGYDFAGWFEGDVLVETILVTREENIELTAKWTPKTYALTLDIDENSILTPGDLSEISFESQTFKVSAKDGYRVRSVEVNGTAIKLNADNEFSIAGIDGAVTIKVVSIARNVFDADMSASYSASDWDTAVYDYYNLSTIGSGGHKGWLGVASAAEPGYIVYKFDAGAGMTFNTMSISGRARVFTYGDTVSIFKLYVRADNGDWTQVKDYQPTLSGTAYTSIEEIIPYYVRGKQVVEIKFEITAGLVDWVCIEQLAVTFARSVVTVSFMDRDGSTSLGSNQNQIKGGIFQALATEPQKAGYSFECWCLDQEGTQPVALDYVVTEALTVYAKWTALTYNITYTLGGGTNAAANPATYTPDDNIALAAATRDDYKFAGWYKTVSGEQVKVEKLGNGEYGELTLVARWLPKYTITYHLDGGTNHSENPAFFFEDEEIFLGTPTKAQHIFAGWYLDAGMDMLVESIEIGTDENIDLYAMWIHDGSAAVYSIIYALDGGTNHASNPASYTEGTAVTLNAPTKAGYTFKGWYSDSAFTTAVTSISADSTGTVNLYAKWAQNFAITYNLDGGTNHASNPATYTAGEELQLNAPTRSGYTFGGWFSDEGLTEAVSSISAESAGDVTLYAKWTKQSSGGCGSSVAGGAGLISLLCLAVTAIIKKKSK